MLVIKKYGKVIAAILVLIGDEAVRQDWCRLLLFPSLQHTHYEIKNF